MTAHAQYIAQRCLYYSDMTRNSLACFINAPINAKHEGETRVHLKHLIFCDNFYFEFSTLGQSRSNFPMQTFQVTRARN